MNREDQAKLISLYHRFCRDLDDENAKRRKDLEDDIEPTFAAFMKWLEYHHNLNTI